MNYLTTGRVDLNGFLQVHLFFLMSGYGLAVRYGSKEVTEVREWSASRYTKTDYLFFLWIFNILLCLRFYITRLARIIPLYYLANLLAWPCLPPQYFTGFNTYKIVQVRTEIL